MRNYLDISVFISPGSDGNYQVQVSSNEGGQGHSTLKLPFRLGDLAGVLFGVEQSKRGLASLSNTQNPADARTIEDFSVALFEALFQGECRDVLAKTEAIAESNGDAVRIRLSMDLRVPGMALAASLPWELMRRKGQIPLALSTKTLLVRSLSVPQPTYPPPFQATLRILAVLSNPVDTPMLKLEEERLRIAKEWAQLGNVKVDFAKPTRTDLLTQLAATDYHVLPYMGHGDIGPNGEGQLLLQKENGLQDPVSGEDLAVMLQDEPLRLVFLNACNSGVASDAQPFSGVATSLITARVPAVVAMQFPVTDQAAIIFAQTFYQRLAQGLPVDAAVAEGRKQLKNSKQAEWATPVLYMRSKDGMLFAPAQAAQPASHAEPSTSAPAGSSPPDPGILRVFLATTDQNLERRQLELAKRLRAEEWIRVMDFSLPEAPQDLELAVGKVIRQADLVVHLLGANPGKAVDEDALPDTIRTYPLEQLRIGLEVASAQLVVMSIEDRASIPNKQYEAKLDQLSQMPREKERLEFVVTEKNSIAEYVLSKLQEMREARQAALKSSVKDPGKARRAFVDAHVKDQGPANELADYLEKRDVDTATRTSGEDSPASLPYLDQTIKKSPLYIIVSGKVDKAWVNNRRTAARKAAAKFPCKLLIAKYSAMLQEPGDEDERMRARLEVVDTLGDPDTSALVDLFSSSGETRS